MDLVDQVAGLFVLLYGQTLVRVAALSVSRVRHDVEGAVLVAFGREEVRLPPMLGALVTELVATRHGRATVGAPPESPWLFPSLQPGRHLRADRLQLRLNAYGLGARAARTSALLDLATEVPPVVLADLLGMYPTPPCAGCRRPAGSGPATPPCAPARLDSRPARRSAGT
ncbi:MAG: hypothetical protein M3P85_01545 [Actinomycetota bacterium]|nr:hypothetical protein [Actinomycetota bacterium]